MKNTTVRLAILIVAVLPIFLGCGEDDPVDDDDKVSLTSNEKELYNLIMDYRDGLGFPSIPLSAGATPTGALNPWKNSSGHNDVIINAGDWTKEWKTIGYG